MSGKSAAILIGDYPELPREIWAGFVQSGLVDCIFTFSTVDDLSTSLKTPADADDVDVKLALFLAERTEDLNIPMDLKLHPSLTRVPLIAFYPPNGGLTDTDRQTLYDRRVSSVIPLPMKFQDLGKLVLQLDRYWSVGKLPQCFLHLPNDKLYCPVSD